MWTIFLEVHPGVYPLVPQFRNLEQAVLFAESVFGPDHGQQWVRVPTKEDVFYGPKILGISVFIKKV